MPPSVDAAWLASCWVMPGDAGVQGEEVAPRRWVPSLLHHFVECVTRAGCAVWLLRERYSPAPSLR